MVKSSTERLWLAQDNTLYTPVTRVHLLPVRAEEQDLGKSV